MATNKPTPTPIIDMRTVLEIVGVIHPTCATRTLTSGSAMVIKKPTRKPEATMSTTFLLCTRADPIRCPMGRIPTSVPSRKMPRPKIMSSPPVRNRIRSGTPIGASVG
ncbi:MAG: hypothetical protein BWY01_01797 [Synergistetes bacterium ADurb.Bin155]|nr:MAG: hypothetical protein BWY01_01797 [Synergistetes bacterium ADurb.Bin155]